MTNLPMTAEESEMRAEHVNVSLDVVWQGTAGRFDARMGEISMDSCFIESMGQEVMGESINFNVHLPAGTWITLRGKVVYQEYPIGFEAQFTDVPPETQNIVTHLVAAHGGKLAMQMVQDDNLLMALGEFGGESRRVLVADDDSMTLEVVKSIVESIGYQAVCATDGREAFNILQDDSNFSAAIFDMSMPHLDGLGLVHFVKSDKRLAGIPIGMITGEQDPRIWEKRCCGWSGRILAKTILTAADQNDGQDA